MQHAFSWREVTPSLCVVTFRLKSESLSPPNVSSSFREHRVSRLTLREDNVAIMDDGSQGFWTMVYDEGLHFELTAPRRRRFFSFFKYELAPEGENTSYSFCSTLMVGWSVHVAHQDSSETELALEAPRYGKLHQASKAANSFLRV